MAHTRIGRPRITFCLHVTAHYFFSLYFHSCRSQVVALSCHWLVSIWISIKRTHVTFPRKYIHIYLYKSCFITSNISSSFGNFLSTWAFAFHNNFLSACRKHPARPFAFSMHLIRPACKYSCARLVICVRFYLDTNQKTLWFYVFWQKNKRILDLTKFFAFKMVPDFSLINHIDTTNDKNAEIPFDKKFSVNKHRYLRNWISCAWNFAWQMSQFLYKIVKCTRNH